MSISTPPKGTHFSDGVRVGPILGSAFTTSASPLYPSAMSASPVDSVAPGTYITPDFLLDFIPAILLTNGICTTQTPAGAGYLTLVQTASIGISLVTSFDASTATSGANTAAQIIVLNQARNVTVTSASNVSAVNFAIFGWDQYGQAMTEEIAGPNNATTQGKKAFKYISGVKVSGAPGHAVTVGYGDIFGLPYYISNANYVFTQKAAGALDAGTIAIGIPAVATATTGDVRGTYAPASASNSVNRLTLNSYSSSGDTRNSNNSAPYSSSQSSNTVYANNVTSTPSAGAVILATNAVVVTNASTVATVTAPDHQFTVGETVKISGCTGADAAVANITSTVATVTNANTFTYTASGNGTAAATGSAITMSPGKGNLYITSYGRFGVTQYSGTPF